MNEIQVTARLKIHQGKLEEFKAIAAECLKTVREKDSGTLQYDWFLTADQSECVLQERYADSQAMLDHMAHVGDRLGALVGLADLSVEVYGDPSPELLDAAKAFNPHVLSRFQGL